MHITELSGHSGCKVQQLETDSGAVFVRKTSSSIEYNKRLIAQAKKQQEYSNDEMHTPKILRMGENEEGLFFFDMEYVRGITLSEFMKIIEVGKIRGLVENIAQHIIRINDNVQGNEDVFCKKIEELSSKLAQWNSEVIQEALEMLESHNWSKFVDSPCHGDLTLENIIVKGDQLYLIDFLDSFCDNWILDVATLLQDVQTLWAYRNQEKVDINTLIRLIIFRDILLDETRQMAGEEYILEIYYALLLKLMRIFPYSIDERTRRFLVKKTGIVIRLINEVGR